MVKRVLTFEDSAKGRDRFSMIYQGFNIGGQFVYVGKVKHLSAARVEMRVLDKLDAVSDAAPEDVKNALIMRSLKKEEGDQVVELSEDEFGLLKSYFEHAAVGWAPVAARMVVQVADWLDGIKQIDVEEEQQQTRRAKAGKGGT